MMHSGYLLYKSSQVHYLSCGKGKTIIGLHGYGEGAASFMFLESYLAARYRLIAIDLPFHGDTNWREQGPFTHVDLYRIIMEIIQSMGDDDRSFVMMGFSMGGRIAMSFTQHFPGLVSRLVLLAPDGMNVNFWYWLCTQTYAGNQLFRFTMQQPGWLFWSLHHIRRLGLVNKSILKFISYYMDDAAVRESLYQRWTCMKSFTPNLKKLRNLISKRKLPVRLMYGKHDRIILPQRSDRLCKGLDDYCGVYLADEGHQVLQEKHAIMIMDLLSS